MTSLRDAYRNPEPPRLVLILALAAGAWFALGLVAAIASLAMGRLL